MNATATKTSTKPKAASAQGKTRAAPAASPKAVATKAAVKPVAKTAVAAAKPTVAKAATAKGKAVEAAGKAVKPVTKDVSKTAPAASSNKVSAQPALKKAAGGPKKPASAAVTASTTIEPTPKPLGKRAAKKVMMEQMMQAAVVPTHAPDAAKATFSSMNERVMTPPVPSSIQKDPKRANNWKTLSVEQLTDADVLAMPDSEYMNELQLAFFRRKLSLLKADMLANAGETTEHLREDTVVVPDPADRATIEEEHALELRTRDRERKLLKKIGQSISRIDAGDYGYCDETGEAIGVARLMARPTASLSLEAQQRRELKQKMFGD